MVDMDMVDIRDGHADAGMMPHTVHDQKLKISKKMTSKEV